MNIEDLIKDAVDDGVRSVPPGFADGAIRRARRQVRTTRIVVASGVAAFAMAAAAVAVVDPVELRTDAPPAESPDPAPAVLVDDVTDFDAVRTGAAPGVPWYADDALHFEGTSTPFDVPFAELSVDRVAGGYVALVVPPGGEQPDDVLYLVPDGGTPEQVDSGELSEVVVSPDGAEFAYAADVAGTGDLPLPGGQMRVADAGTGDRLHADDALTRGGRPLYYVGSDQIAVQFAVGTVAMDGLYHPGDEILTDSATSPVDLPFAELAPGRELVKIPQGNGYAIATLEDGELGESWALSPSEQSMRFSPDGRLVASVRESRDGTTLVTTWDARTGAVMGRFEAARTGPPAWESPTTVLFSARSGDGDREAIVRCTVDAGCELATEPLDTSETESAIILGE